MKLYTCHVVEQLIEEYENLGGKAVTIEEGSLGYGLMILYGEGLKCSIVTEVYLNEWSSGHKIRMYNEMPEKYRKMLEDVGEPEETLAEIVGKRLIGKIQ